MLDMPETRAIMAQQRVGNTMKNIGQTAGTMVTAALLTGLSATPGFAGQLLTSHVPDPVARHQVQAVGVPDPRTVLHLDVALPMRNDAQLDALLQRIYDPKSPQYHHYLTVAQFADQFGPSQSDYGKAEKFFGGSALQITRTNANRYMIEVTGRVADIEKVFHVKFNLYKHPSENRNFLAPDREPSVDLDVPLLHVTGLDNYILPTPRVTNRQTVGEDQNGGTGSGPGGQYIGSDMRAAYYGGSALTGAGQSLALMELEGYVPADIPLYFSTVGQPLNVPVNGISVDGTKVDCGNCGDAEQALDIEYAISMAPGLAQVQVYVAASPDAILEAMASDNTSKQLSTSWGWNENFDVEDPLWKEMAAQGQSFFTASGDFSNLKASGPWPEQDANLTAVGGTDLVTTGPGGAYVSETGWSHSAGGPSLDKTIKIEKYQKPFINAQNMGSTKLRNVPDVSAEANTNLFICADGKCEGGYGGTSFASPMWAGFIALVNQQASQNGKAPAGFVNPTLYKLSKKANVYATIIHDVVGGQSGVYTAVPGYDLVTGLGSPNGQGLIDALAP
jgi:kumamolisin